MNNKIIILTGEIQTGKTSSLQQFCLQKNNVAGILTPIVESKRMFYDISQKHLFAMEAVGNEETLAVGKYLFSSAAFTKANNILAAAAKRNDIDYLIIDEIGPLELKQQKGLFESLKAILSSAFNYRLIIVVRRGLVEDVIAGFNLDKGNISIVNDGREILDK